MAIADRGWSDRAENYVDSWALAISGTTATAINSSGNSPYLDQPIVIYSLTVSVNPAVGSGDVSLIDSTSSGDVTPLMVRMVIASAASQTYTETISFPRGLVFGSGVLVSATTITGAVTISYKDRY